MLKFICYPKCTTCQKVRKWLDENNIEYEFRDIKIDKAGKYQLSVDYRGTNTTGVKVSLYMKTISCNGEELFSKDIFPSDVRYVTHSLNAVTLPVGTLRIGIKLDTPPVFGRIRNLRLVEITA